MSFLSTALIRFGKIITSDITTAVKVSVPKNVLDERLLMYFLEYDQVYAYDTKKECQEGDFVTIRELPERKDKQIYHIVEKVIYKDGYFVDPLTGKRCVSQEFMSDINRTCDLFQTPSSFEKKDKLPS